MIICLVFWHTYRIPQLSDDPAAIWRSRSHFVKHYDPRVRLLDGPHGHLDIIMVEVPILLFQPYTSPSAMVKAGLTTVNSKWFNGVWRLSVTASPMAICPSSEGDRERNPTRIYDPWWQEPSNSLCNRDVSKQTFNTHDCLSFFC